MLRHVRDYRNRRGVALEFFRQTGPTVLHSTGQLPGVRNRGVLERIATPRKDHRHSERLTGLQQPKCFRDGDRKPIAGHARNSTRDRGRESGNRARYLTTVSAFLLPHASANGNSDKLLMEKSDPARISPGAFDCYRNFCRLPGKIAV